MAYPTFLKRLFEKNGAGPRLTPRILPNATATEQGVIGPGTGLSVDDAGTVSIKPHTAANGNSIGRASGSLYGHVLLTDDFNNTSNAASGVGATPAMVNSAVNSLRQRMNQI